MDAIPSQAETDRPLTIAAMFAVGNAGGYSTVVLPMIVTVATQRLHLDSGSGAIAAAEMAGMAAGTFFAGLRMPTVNRRSLIVFGALVAIAGNLTTWMAGTLGVLIGIRLIAGSGGGILLATMAAGVGTTTHAERNFAFSMAISFAVATVSFKWVPTLAQFTGELTVFYVMALFSVTALFAAARFPRYSPLRPVQVAMVDKPSARLSPAAILALCGNLVFYTGIGGVWPLMERIGASLGVSHAAASEVLARASIAALMGAMTASMLGVKLGRVVALCIGVAVLVASLAFLGIASSAAAFGLAPLAFLFAWWFTVPYLMGTIASIDPTGRAVAIDVTLQFVGLTLGPLLASLVLRFDGPLSVVWMGAVGVIVSLALTTHAIRRNEASKRVSA